MACSELNKNAAKVNFAKSLGVIAEVCSQDSEFLSLLMDVLVVIGDLTASESFTESAFFVQNDLYSVLNNILASPIIAKIEPVFNPSSEISAGSDLTKVKF